MMDLGATLCIRSTPACTLCPLAADCQALANGDQRDYPGKKPRKVLPVKATCFLIMRNTEGEVWLEKRPSSGIWGGLWCFPEINDPQTSTQHCLDLWGIEPITVAPQSAFRHTFSHYHLDITPIIVELGATPHAVMEAPRQLWYNLSRPPQIGLAAPVASLLETLASRHPQTEY